MDRPKRRRESSRIRKRIDSGKKMQAMLRGLLSARKRLGKPFQFYVRRLLKYVARGTHFARDFARGLETSVCKQSLLQDLKLHSGSPSMEYAGKGHHKASAGRPQKSGSRTRGSYDRDLNHPQRYKTRNRRSSGIDAAEKCRSKLVTPSEKSICYSRRKRQNQVGPIPQTPPLCPVSTHDQSIIEEEPREERLVIEIGRSQSTSEPPEFVKLLQSVSNRESPPEGSARKKQGPRVQGFVHTYDRKIAPVCVKLPSQLVCIQNQQADIDVTKNATSEAWKLCNEIAEMQRRIETIEQNERSKVSSQRDQILSQNQTIKILRSKVKELEKYKQRNAISGSYAEGSPTPTVLHTAFFDAKTAVTRLQKCFADDATESEHYPASVKSLLSSDSSFGRRHHVEYAFKAVVNQVFFEGFENESFNTVCGAAKFVDPDLRQAKFYEYYWHSKKEQSAGIMEDPQYKEFFDMKHENLCEKLNLRSCKSEEGQGGPQTDSLFEAVARSVWLLHKLAFSFEPPANIFRVERGADMNQDYMEPVEDLEACRTFVPKVGFMVAPGLRLRRTVLRCQVYVS